MTECGAISNRERKKEPKWQLVEKSENQRVSLSIHVVSDLLYNGTSASDKAESVHGRHARDEDSNIFLSSSSEI